MSEPVSIDLVSDYAFKRIFGSEPNKDLLISLLNGLFRGRKSIVDLLYEKNEHVGDSEEIGTVIFDLICTADNGEKFVIEVQRTAQINLKKRMLYYSSKLIADQAPKGKRRAWLCDHRSIHCGTYGWIYFFTSRRIQCCPSRYLFV